MELKTKYQYTNFIYPYIIKQEIFEKYLLGLLKNKKCRIKFFEKEKDQNIYKFFLPRTREYMFKTFGYSMSKVRKFNKLDLKMQATVLSKYPCTIFEYDIDKQAQGKIGDEYGIFFGIQKIEIICFNSGVCFINIKTNVEDESSFADVLNFNYKFSEINSEFKDLRKYENIKIQSNQFSDITKLSEIIREITQNSKEEELMNININRFFTFAYACLEPEYWNDQNDYENIKEEFYKFAKVYKYEKHVENPTDKVKTYDIGDYAKLGISNDGVSLLCSGANQRNYTKLPFCYENQYLYTFIYTLYQKIIINMLLKEFENKKEYDKTKNKFIEFTNEVWIYDITNDDIGEELYDLFKNKMNLERMYQELKNKFNIMYKDFNINKHVKINKAILAVLFISIIVNIIVFCLKK